MALQSSILRYQDRGKWGKSSYRGNVSGHVIKDLLETYKPKKFVEVFSGGGTDKDVATDLGIENSVHLDLLTGWDALKDEMPVQSDFVFSHPPYWDIIDYATQRGSYDKDDLSNAMPYDTFIEKLDVINEKIYDSLVKGGRHAFLVGDVRKKGHYYSIIKDMTWYGDLECHLIKEQFNTVSGRKSYGGTFIPIAHEHLLVFKKNEIWQVNIKYTKDFTRTMADMPHATWHDLIYSIVRGHGVTSLADLYDALAQTAKAKGNTNWQAKARQVVQDERYFERVARGTYQVA
jgi:hypothetical protein